MKKDMEILVIEDNRGDILALQKFFKDSSIGNNVHYVTSLSEGQKLLDEYHFDLVLLDINLPDGNGIDLIRQVKDANHGVKVICLSGHSDYVTVSNAEEAGAIGFIQKPLTMQMLQKVNSKIEDLSLTWTEEKPDDFTTNKPSLFTVFGAALVILIGTAASSEKMDIYSLHIADLTKIIAFTSEAHAHE